jgi:ubiquinone/menaquinone biosynthesis C-methylase UbiE
MVPPDRALEINCEAWNCIAPLFRGRDALPAYGPLASTEDELRLLSDISISRVLELGCGSGHSLAYLAERGADELWGIDFSSTQIALAKETLQSVADKTRLLKSPMEQNPGVPENYFDLVFSIYGIGWSTDLAATMALVTRYLRPGGCFIASGEHPVYSCLEWNGAQYVMAKPYSSEGPQEHQAWNGVPIVIQRRTLATFVEHIVRAGLHVEALIETSFKEVPPTPDKMDPCRWYSIPRASIMPTTLIVKATKSSQVPSSRRS